MRSGRYLVFDVDFDVLEPFKDCASAVRFARWLARGRGEDYSVLVSDERHSGEIVWPAPAWPRSGAFAS